MPKALHPGKDHGVTILIGGKRTLKIGDMMGTVVIPFKKLETEEDYEEIVEMAEEIIDFWETQIYSSERESTPAAQRFSPAEDQPRTLLECWPQINQYLSGTIICAHNLGVDKTLLTSSFPLFKAESYLDSLHLFRSLYKQKVQDYSLTSLLQTFQLMPELESWKLNDHFVPHRALFDAAGCAILIKYLLLNPQTKSIFDQPEQGMLDL